jgi:biotin carboxyl carrier protein
MHDVATATQSDRGRARGAKSSPRTDTDTFASPESTPIDERVVVSPCSGRFAPLPPEMFTAEGEWIEPDQVVAEVRSGSSSVQVRSAFRGWMMGMLAVPGQPVKSGEALFWVRGR